MEQQAPRTEPEKQFTSDEAHPVLSDGSRGIEELVAQLVTQAIANIYVGIVREPVGTAVVLGLIVGAITSTFSGFLVGIGATYIGARLIAELSDSSASEELNSSTSRSHNHGPAR